MVGLFTLIYRNHWQGRNDVLLRPTPVGSILLRFLFYIALSSLVLSSIVQAQSNYPNCVQVNSTIEGHQDSPEIAVNGVGTVLVVFESSAQGPDENIFAISYDRVTFREFYHTGPTTDTASLEAFPDDERFVVTWEQNGKIYFTIWSCKDEEEVMILPPTPVASGIRSIGQRPDVAISSDGSLFVIGWHTSEVTMQFFDDNGNRLGQQVSVADVHEYQQAQISVKFWPDSCLAATWYSETSGSFGPKTKDRDIWFQLFDCKPVWQNGEPGKLLPQQLRANGDLTNEVVWNDQEYPEIDVFNDGRFVIMWQDFPYSDLADGTDGSGKGAYFRIFNRDGTPFTDDTRISEHTYSFQKDADIRIRQSDKTIHFIYEDAYESTPEKPWLAYPSYRSFDEGGYPTISSFELSDKSYGTDCRIAITEPNARIPNLVLCVWETKDIENYDGSGRAVIFRDITSETKVEPLSEVENIPQHLRLFHNYPNPFNSSTIISYRLSQPSNIHLNLYDLTGHEVQRIINEYQTAGEYSVQIKADALPSGIYLCSLCVGDQTTATKITLIK